MLWCSRLKLEDMWWNAPHQEKYTQKQKKRKKLVDREKIALQVYFRAPHSAWLNSNWVPTPPNEGRKRFAPTCCVTCAFIISVNRLAKGKYTPLLNQSSKFMFGFDLLSGLDFSDKWHVTRGCSGSSAVWIGEFHTTASACFLTSQRLDVTCICCLTPSSIHCVIPWRKWQSLKPQIVYLRIWGSSCIICADAGCCCKTFGALC